MAKVINMPGASPVDPGEALIVQHLLDALPDTYTLIPNIEIAEPGRAPYEYDLIVVATHAVYVVEVKRWRGGITGNDTTWIIGGYSRRPNPLRTTHNKARVLKSQIAYRQPACAGVWVEAVVAIADDQGALHFQGQCRDRVFRYTDLTGFLTDKSALGSHAGDWRAQRAYIEKAIQEAAHGRTEKQRTFGAYLVKEELVQRPDVSEYLAQNTLLRTDELVRLRVFPYDPYLPQDELKRRGEVIRREAEALYRIGRHDNLIGGGELFTSPEDPNLFVEVTDWSTEGTLRDLLAGPPLTLDRKLDLAQGITAGLKAVHAAGVIHRDLRPENVLIDRNGRPRLMNFERARLTTPNAVSIGPIFKGDDAPPPYTAPELLGPYAKATPACDLYSLGLILFELLVGDLPFASPADALRAGTIGGGPLAYGIPDVPKRLDDLVRYLAKLKPEERPQNADEVLAVLQAVRQQPTAATIPPPAVTVTPLPATTQIEPVIFAIGDSIDDKYQVQAVMPPGGSGRVYKVYDPIWDSVYALKLFNDTALSIEWLRQEVRTLKEFNHPNIVKVNTWGRLPSGRVYLVSEFVEGEELTTYVSGEKRMPARQAAEVISQLLTALEALHVDVDRLERLKEHSLLGELTAEEYEELQTLQATGWLHRDIKPANLMLSGDTLKLIDFNIAAKAHEVGRTYTGTQGYMPPDVGIVPWDTSCDLFAVAIVLYELITGHHPYPDRTPNADDPPADPRQFVPTLAPRFAELLLHAVSVDRSTRYRSARRFRQDLAALDSIYLRAQPSSQMEIPLMLRPDEIGRMDYNPFVTRFLTLYSQARRSNRGTRGLDEIARLTYVDTRLDRLLKPAVLDGQYRLVIITGNAGDGKTAFIKNLETAVTEAGSVVESSAGSENSSRFQHNGLQFVTNYDGSQDEGAERANDQVLDEFFGPFASGALPSDPRVHLIAINEGRLIDFFGSTLGKVKFAGLARYILGYFDGDGDGLPPWLLIVDLNQRSMVATDTELVAPASIFDRQLQAFLKPEFWAPCSSCRWRTRCPIKFNVDTLADPVSGPMVWARLRTLFEIVHLRRQLHITMRDLRSALTWLLFQDQDCHDVAELLNGDPEPGELLQRFYFNAYAAESISPPERADDRLVRLLREIDPAETANPKLDRDLYFRSLCSLPSLAFDERTPTHIGLLQTVRSSLRDGWEAVQAPESVRQRQTYQEMLRRIAFFERRDDGWRMMVPYSHLDSFEQATAGVGEQHQRVELLHALKKSLVEGISRAEGARNEQLAQRYICLRAGQETEARIKSFRLFPLADFQVEVPTVRLSSARYLEYTPDRLLLYHAPSDVRDHVRGARRAELQVSLDVLELLAQIREGFVPSLNDIRGFYINLVIFKNALTHLPYREVLLTRDDHTFYRLALTDTSTAVLQPVQQEAITL